ADRNRSHWSTSKTPSYTKSVSWQHHLGSLGGQLDVEPKRWFALGTISASFLWFFGLAILAAWLAPRLRTAKSQRIINLVVGCVMWFIALQLARDGIAHAQALFS
ncbi:LysE family transporter, partial [Escherichia coli]|uniref:LysE family transporter n=1 Tax=Escherichia coli TaxID=562 RepID=UPI00201FC69F